MAITRLNPDYESRIAALEARTLLSASGPSGTQTYTSGTIVSLVQLSVPSGLWIIHGWATISPASNTQIRLLVTGSSTTITSADRTEFTNAGRGIYHNMNFYNVSQTAPFYLNLQYEANGTWSYAGMRALKVR